MVRRAFIKKAGIVSMLSGIVASEALGLDTSLDIHRLQIPDEFSLEERIHLLHLEKEMRSNLAIGFKNLAYSTLQPVKVIQQKKQFNSYHTIFINKNNNKIALIKKGNKLYSKFL